MPESTSDSLNAAIGDGFKILKTFRCPQCWGPEFGAYVAPITGEELLYCHNPGRLCGWRGRWSDVAWQRFDADWAAFGELVEALEHRVAGFELAWNGEIPGWVADIRVVALPHYGVDIDMRRALALATEKALPAIGVRDAAARALGLAAGGEGAR